MPRALSPGVLRLVAIPWGVPGWESHTPVPEKKNHEFERDVGLTKGRLRQAPGFVPGVIVTEADEATSLATEPVLN